MKKETIITQFSGEVDGPNYMSDLNKLKVTSAFQYSSYMRHIIAAHYIGNLVKDHNTTVMDLGAQNLQLYKYYVNQFVYYLHPKYITVDFDFDNETKLYAESRKIQIYTGDVHYIWNSLPKVDVIVGLEIIEHLNRKWFETTFWQTIKDKCDYLIISTPNRVSNSTLTYPDHHDYEYPFREIFELAVMSGWKLCKWDGLNLRTQYYDKSSFIKQKELSNVPSGIRNYVWGEIIKSEHNNPNMFFQCLYFFSKGDCPFSTRSVTDRDIFCNNEGINLQAYDNSIRTFGTIDDYTISNYVNNPGIYNSENWIKHEILTNYLSYLHDLYKKYNLNYSTEKSWKLSLRSLNKSVKQDYYNEFKILIKEIYNF